MIMNRLKNISAVLLASLLCLALGACGGDDNDVSGPTEAAVTFTLVSLDPSEVVGSIYVDLDLPLGFVLAPIGGALPAGVVSSDARLPAAGISLTNYTPEALPARGQLFVSLISARDFAPGAVFTVVKSLTANEALPAASDFNIVGLEVFDGTGLVLGGYTLTVEVQQRAATL